MPITVAHEPNGLFQALLSFVAGFGEQKQAFDAMENQQRAQTSQRRADAVGGAVGKIGSSYFDGLRLKEERALEDRRTAQKQAFQQLYQRNAVDLQKYGMPTADIDGLAAQSGMDPFSMRRELGFKKAMDEMTAKGLDPHFEFGLTPADERKYMDLLDQYKTVNDPNGPALEPEELERINDGILSGMSSINLTRMPRKQALPETWDDLVQANRVVEEEVPGGRIVKYFDRSGAPRTDFIKYADTGEQEEGLITTKSFDKWYSKAENDLIIEGNPDPTRDQTVARMKENEIRTYTDFGLPVPESVRRRNQMPTGASPVSGQPTGIPWEQPPLGDYQPAIESGGNPAQQAWEQLAAFIETPGLGDDPRQWPKPVIDRAKSAASIAADDLKAQWGGVSADKIPEEVRIQASALKYILEH